MSAPRPPVNKWLVTLSVTFGTLMGTIDASIVNVALPHIRGSVGATLEEIMTTMSWQKHTVRGFMAGAMKKAGYAVESFKSEKGERTYRINA